MLTFLPPGKTRLSQAPAVLYSVTNVALCFPIGPEGHDEESRWSYLCGRPQAQQKRRVSLAPVGQTRVVAQTCDGCVCCRVVEFASRSDMKSAISKFDGTELNGRKLKVFEDSRKSVFLPANTFETRVLLLVLNLQWRLYSAATARAGPAPEATPDPRAAPGAATGPGAAPGLSVAPQRGSHQVGARVPAGPPLGPSPAQSPRPGLARGPPSPTQTNSPAHVLAPGPGPGPAHVLAPPQQIANTEAVRLSAVQTDSCWWWWRHWWSVFLNEGENILHAFFSFWNKILHHYSTFFLSLSLSGEKDWQWLALFNPPSSVCATPVKPSDSGPVLVPPFPPSTLPGLLEP